MVQLGSGYGFPSNLLGTHLSVFQAAQNGPLFQNPTSALNSTLRTNLAGTTVPSVDINDPLHANVVSLNTGMTSLNGSLVDFQTHTDSVVSGLPTNMGVVENGINLTQTISPTPVASVCDQIQNFFGSILGAGAALIGGVTAIISTIAGIAAQIVQYIAAATNELLIAIQTAITAVLSTITGLVNQIQAMIAAEVAALASLISQALNFALGGLISSIKQSSCLQLVIEAAGTAGLAAALVG